MKLTQLDLSHNNLSVIPTWALTYLHNLQILHLENNRIDVLRSNTFDETQLNNLQFLYLDNNQLRIIPNLAFNHLRLVVLMLANNRITEIQKMSLPHTLNFLVLRNNLLTQIPYVALNDLKMLQSIDLEGNNITHLLDTNEVTFESEMKVILRNNKIRRLDKNSFRSFRKIRELDISYNQIQTIEDSSFETVGHMQSLDLSYNKIAYLPRGMLKNFAKTLKTLKLAENMVHATPEALRDLRNLTHLNLNGNKLNRIDGDVLRGCKDTLVELFIANNYLENIPHGVLSGMKQLEHLDISKNKIMTLKKPSSLLSITTDENSSVRRLNLAGNRINNMSDVHIFEHMPFLTYVDVSFNRIRFISPRVFEKLKSLESLFLQNNQMTHFPSLFRLEKLRHLMLDNNQIQKIDNFSLADLPKLQHLSLAGNQIDLITENMFGSSSSSELKSLNLAHNKIYTISSRSFSDLDNLQQLRLSHNNIRTIPSMTFANLKNLRYLDLSHNRIIKILPSALYQLPALDVLHLDQNNLNEIDRDAFRSFGDLQTFKLSHNAFRRFSCEFLGSITQIHQLDLSSNQINEIDVSCIARGLRKLSLASNSVEKIHRKLLQDATELVSIDISHNGIIDVDSDAFAECRKLADVKLSHNYIRNLWKGTFQYQVGLSFLSVLKEFSFQEKLHSLDISFKIVDSSQLTSFGNLSVLSFANNKVDSIEDGAFENLLSLKILDLSNNPVTSWSPTAFRDLSHSISSINMANTGLFSMPKFSHRSIQSLNISCNKIYELSERDLAPLTKLVALDISHNNLKQVSPLAFEPLIHLKQLNISANPITHLTNDHIQQLYQLYNIPDMARPYQISSILSNLPPLHTIYVDIKEPVLDRQFYTADTRLLRHLVVFGKNMTQLDVGAFATVRGFKVRIEVHNSSIQEFPTRIFETLTGISILSLSLTDNKLTTFNPFQTATAPVVNQHGTILHSLELQNNPINCDCQFKWVDEFIRVTSLLSDHHKSQDFDKVECADSQSSNLESFASAANELFSYRKKTTLLSKSDDFDVECAVKFSRHNSLFLSIIVSIFLLIL
ncbi:Protein CBG02687 [Caenorhabditis briggsae]|uniref:Protein CBG02687 n=1 Tax=Caenorhabditis briggsae TaxID=6238 RepID=A8WTR1_CAEBR|nr:Protein CBG02687 [Caenorhabditis briggsae]CAP23873.1 Protein CBG02687 [Caenorhabditis briggsae]